VSDVSAETRAQILQLVHLEVRGTTRDREQVVQEVMERLEADLDGFVPGDLEPVVARLTDEQLQTHRLEQTTWAQTTDCDRLDAVFAGLERDGFLVGPDFGYTQDAALADLSEVMDAHDHPEDLRGYVFYTRQDLERVMETGSLMLGFGMVNDSPSATEVGKIIAEAFKQAGFQLEWNGKTNARIGVVGIDWKKRRGFE
jgi:hypothetical protein